LTSSSASALAKAAVRKGRGGENVFSLRMCNAKGRLKSSSKEIVTGAFGVERQRVPADSFRKKVVAAWFVDGKTSFYGMISNMNKTENRYVTYQSVCVWSCPPTSTGPLFFLERILRAPSSPISSSFKSSNCRLVLARNKQCRLGGGGYLSPI
jgi:hypothetical protein